MAMHNRVHRQRPHFGYERETRWEAAGEQTAHVPPEVAWPPDPPTEGVVFSRFLADEFALADPDERFELLIDIFVDGLSRRGPAVRADHSRELCRRSRY